jgi:hydroxysqualene dehydroxylase
MKVAVIGGGWAGCAAAVALAQRGHAVQLYEAAPMPGGRARTVQRDGFALDNGQHVLLGAYTGTRALIDALHPQASPIVRTALAMTSLRPGGLALRARALPAPLGLAAGLMTARGLTLRERIGAVRGFLRWKRQGFRCAPGQTVSELLGALPHAAARELWSPLCVAALNTPPGRASAQVFLNVIAAAFDARADAADVILPTGSIGDALPHAAARWLIGAGHEVRCGTTGIVTACAPAGVRIRAGDREEDADAAIVAVGPHQLARAFAPDVAPMPALADALAIVARYGYESITTIYLGYRGGSVALPAGLVRLDDVPGQWLFARDDILRDAASDAPPLDQLLAVVISTSGPHDTLSHEDLAQACDAQLRRLLPALPALAWSQAIAERRATYACVPGLAHPGVRLAPRLYLAGDYVYPHFPATLEAAVRSGAAAAAALDDDSRSGPSR